MAVSIASWVRSHPVAVGVGVGVVALHAGAYAFFAVRDPYRETIFPPCILLHFTGWQCPGCGGTRAMFSLLHGDVATSIAMNPLVVAGYLAVAISLVGMAAARRGTERFSRVLYGCAATVAIGAALWSALLRNLLP